jgi:ribose transport system substrate-binding protein
MKKGTSPSYGELKRNQIMLKNLLLLTCGVSLLAVAGCNNTGTSSSDGATSSTGTTSGSGGAATTSNSGGSKPTIAVIPKGTTHSYWKSVQAGANQAGEELGANIIFKGPVKEDDRAQQISIVQQFTSGSDTAAIVLAPLDDTALVKSVKAAKTKKIPVVIIDSALKGKPGTDYDSYVATNNTKGGELAGERLVKLLGGKGKVVLLRYQEGSASTAQREEGFLSVMKKNPGIIVTVSNRYGGATTGEAKTAALNMVDRLKEANGIFAPNESSTLGMLLALRQANLAGQKKFVGFDASSPLLDGLNKGEINALVVQNPTKMGYEGVRVALAAVKGDKAPTDVDTGVAVVDKDNINSPEIKEIVGSNK